MTTRLMHSRRFWAARVSWGVAVTHRQALVMEMTTQSAGFLWSCTIL